MSSYAYSTMLPDIPFYRISMSIAYDVQATSVAGILVGNEIAVAAFIHPQLYRMSGKVHAQAASVLASALGSSCRTGMPWHSP